MNANEVETMFDRAKAYCDARVRAAVRQTAGSIACGLLLRDIRKFGYMVPVGTNVEDRLAVALMAIARSMVRQVAEASADPEEGRKLYWVENWPLTIHMSRDGDRLQGSQRAGPLWLSDEEARDLGRPPADARAVVAAKAVNARSRAPTLDGEIRDGEPYPEILP